MKTHTNTSNTIKYTEIHKIQLICTLDFGKCKYIHFWQFLRKTKVQSAIYENNILLLQQFNFVIRYKPVAKMQVADTLSRRKTAVKASGGESPGEKDPYSRNNLFYCYIKMWTYQRPYIYYTRYLIICQTTCF
jgi:hypothetical protein